ncbi:MAG: hypothetical protein D6776_11570, partial [Planctomycetota bacterium]
MKPTHAWLELTCLTDVAVSATAASVGGHEVLPYIPGSALLGAAAARLYPALLKEEDGIERCWATFHDGSLRFGPGWPASSAGAPAWPAPLSLHHEKDSSPGAERIAAEAVENLAARDASFRPRMKQLRGVHVDAFGHLVRPRLRESLRTAVDPRSGRARTGLLYELNALAADTRLIARVEADDAAALERVVDALTGEEEIVLGRSRRAELGRVRVRRLAAPPPEPAVQDTPPTDEAVFWCVSDLAWRDPDTGQPAFVPPPQALGLPADWHYAPERSFVRTRVYSPFNAHRRRPDLERQVILGGSVLVYEGESPCDPAAVRAAIARGTGLYRECGLGRLAYAPRCLAGLQPRFESPPAAGTGRKGTDAPAPRSALIDWLQRERLRETLEDAAWKLAKTLRDELLAMPAWRRLPPSQWYELARQVQRRPGNPLRAVREFTGSSMRKLP